MEATSTPNHHADHPGFSGIGAWIAGLTMVPGRGPVARLVCDLAGVGPADVVVDVGSGPGAAAREAARRSATVIGVEPSGEMRRLASLLTAGRVQVDWTGGVAEALPLGDGDATVVWSVATVHHWPDLDAGLAEVHRVLSPGGRFLAVERRTHAGATGLASHGWTEAQAEAFAATCRDTGFVDVVVSTQRAGRFTGLAVQAVRP